MVEQFQKYAHTVGLRRQALDEALVAHQNYARALEAEVTSASISARYTARLLLWLPWVALIFSQLAGMPALSYLAGAWGGWLTLVFALGLTAFASSKANRWIAQMAATPADPGFWLEAVARSLADGLGLLSISKALRAHCLDREALALVEGCLGKALAGDKSVASVLRTKAKQLRAELQVQKKLAIAKLPFRLLLLNGGIMLPQFMVLLLVPTVGATFQAGTAH